MTRPFISIIIPLAKKEKEGEPLKKILENWQQVYKNTENSIEVLWLFSEHKSSRAKLMNDGARKAQGQFLWFLHADSHLKNDAFNHLLKTINKYPSSLIYFNLAFKPHFFLMKINSFGANIRSHIFKLPFGDQGFCLSKIVFNELKGYDETAKYGEDHLLVWSAKKRKIKITNCKSTLTTSSRKYQKNGWLKITFIHQYLFFKQIISVLKK